MQSVEGPQHGQPQPEVRVATRLRGHHQEDEPDPDVGGHDRRHQSSGSDARGESGGTQVARSLEDRTEREEQRGGEGIGAQQAQPGVQADLAHRAVHE